MGGTHDRGKKSCEKSHIFALDYLLIDSQRLDECKNEVQDSNEQEDDEYFDDDCFFNVYEGLIMIVKSICVLLF